MRLPDHVPHTRYAMTMAEVARDAGRELHHEVHMAVFAAYFADGRDIGHKEVLLDIAEETGLSTEDVAAAWLEDRYAKRLHGFYHVALSLGIDAVPAALICNRLLDRVPALQGARGPARRVPSHTREGRGLGCGDRRARSERREGRRLTAVRDPIRRSMATQRPCVIVPTFWTKAKVRDPEKVATIYDHPTPSTDGARLPACLQSLSQLPGVDHVVVIVAATDPSVQRRGRGQGPSRSSTTFPSSTPFVFGARRTRLAAPPARAARVRRHDRRRHPQRLRRRAQRRPDGRSGARSRPGASSSTTTRSSWTVTSSRCALYGLGAKLHDGTPLLAKSRLLRRPRRARSSARTRPTGPTCSGASATRSTARSPSLTSPAEDPASPPSLSAAAWRCIGTCSPRCQLRPLGLRGEDMDYVINVRHARRRRLPRRGLAHRAPAAGVP